MPDPAVDSRWLGPYRVVRSIGRGGMGEVVLAEDPRLERRVAIKRLRMDAEEEAAGPRGARQARFQREAKALAKLRHPAIVQVYELLTVDGVDHLVMEYVDGPDLRQVLEADGPLPAGEVVRLGLRLAEGLGHAHRHGIVHRDLKTENVLLDPDGEPRIADFGLAQSHPPLGLGEDRLTAEGRIIGTVRAMAPEQIAGEAVDQRTDLFALGVLLAETLTGESPFSAPSPRQTLKKVLAEPPRLAVATEAPPELTELIHQLLEKEPALRPRSASEVAQRLSHIAARDDATEVIVSGRENLSGGRRGEAASWPWGLAAVVVLAVLLVWTLLHRQGAPRELPPLHVVVLDPVVEGLDGAEADIAALAVRTGALRALGQLQRVVILSFSEVDRPALDGRPEQIARALAADAVLSSKILCNAAECWLELLRLDGESEAVLWSQSLEAPRGEPQTLSWATERAVLASLPQRHEADSKVMPPELVAEILPLRFAETQGTASLDPEQAYQSLSELRRRFGSHPELELWQARMAEQRFAISRDPTWLERGAEVLAAAIERHPDDIRLRLAQASLEMTAGRIDAAEDLLEETSRQVEGNILLEEMRARLAMAKGDAPRAIELMQEVVQRRPSWGHLYNLARMATSSGDLDLARETLDALDHRAPGNVLGRRLRANVEMKFGDLDRSAALFETLTAEAPNVTAWTNLGVVHLLRRDGPAALAALQRARELDPANVLVQLNLADAHALVGDERAAEALYQQVAESLRAATGTDPQTLLVRAQAQARLGQVQAAVVDLETAIRQAPESPAVRFEAALVYALVGDLISAERNRRKALELGMEERWFSLAAFDVLR
ncbi:MAG: protein kinase [Acidobacteriota bacterium]|nr:protein kinase [Acidobacteriota bacterium]